MDVKGAQPQPRAGQGGCSSSSGGRARGQKWELHTPNPDSRRTGRAVARGCSPAAPKQAPAPCRAERRGRHVRGAPETAGAAVTLPRKRTRSARGLRDVQGLLPATDLARGAAGAARRAAKLLFFLRTASVSGLPPTGEGGLGRTRGPRYAAVLDRQGPAPQVTEVLSERTAAL